MKFQLLRRLRQKSYKFMASLGYSLRSCQSQSQLGSSSVIEWLPSYEKPRAQGRRRGGEGQQKTEGHKNKLQRKVGNNCQEAHLTGEDSD
jgi:transposase